MKSALASTASALQSNSASSSRDHNEMKIKLSIFCMLLTHIGRALAATARQCRVTFVCVCVFRVAIVWSIHGKLVHDAVGFLCVCVSA